MKSSQDFTLILYWINCFSVGIAKWVTYVMGISSHIGSYVVIRTCFLFLAKLLRYHWVVCHRNLIDLFTTLIYHSNLKMRFPRANITIFINFLLLSCRCSLILKYYIYPRSFSPIRKKQLWLGELCQRVPDFRLSWICLDLKICQIC